MLGLTCWLLRPDNILVVANSKSPCNFQVMMLTPSIKNCSLVLLILAWPVSAMAFDVEEATRNLPSSPILTFKIPNELLPKSISDGIESLVLPYAPIPSRSGPRSNEYANFYSDSGLIAQKLQGSGSISYQLHQNALIQPDYVEVSFVAVSVKKFGSFDLMQSSYIVENFTLEELRKSLATARFKFEYQFTTVRSKVEQNQLVREGCWLSL
jgi:hypothetical protein